MAKQKKSTTLFFDGRKYSKIYVLEWQYQIQSIYFKAGYHWHYNCRGLHGAVDGVQWRFGRDSNWSVM